MPESMSDSHPTSSFPSPTALVQPRRKRRWPRILLWSGCGLLVLLAAGPIGAGVLWLRSASKAALPQLDGDVHLAGLSAPVTVRRDAHGVPHIEAATQDDLFVAQGYVTAQDRLWQMDACAATPTATSPKSWAPRWSSTTRRSASSRFASPPSASTIILPAADRAPP